MTSTSTSTHQNLKPDDPTLLDPKQALKEVHQKRKELEKDLIKVEKQIYEFEGTYLEDTAIYGNVVKGWEKYLTLKASNVDLSKLKKFDESDRLFSYSSVTSDLAVKENCGGYRDHLKIMLKEQRLKEKEGASGGLGGSGNDGKDKSGNKANAKDDHDKVKDMKSHKLFTKSNKRRSLDSSRMPSKKSKKSYKR